MVRLERKMRRGDDAELIHDLRVASRRLREALEVLGFCLPHKARRDLLARVQRVTQTLRDARDADVAAIRLTDMLAAARSIPERTALRDLLSRLDRKRKQQHFRARKTLKKEDIPGWRKLFREALTSRDAVKAASAARDPSQAAAILESRLQEVFARLGTTGGIEDVGGWHALRIAVKRLRYTVELLADGKSAAASGILRQLRQLQTAMGEMHDTHLLAKRVRRRWEKGRKAGAAASLLRGYRAVEARLLREHRTAYAKSRKLWLGASIEAWRRRLILVLLSLPVHA